MMMKLAVLFFLDASLVSSAFSFAPTKSTRCDCRSSRSSSSVCAALRMSPTKTDAAAAAAAMVDPSQRDARYGNNIAQYLVDLHDSKATFDFCGGMMFQLVLSPALREHLVDVSTAAAASSSDPALAQKQQPVVFDASHNRMFRLPMYDQSAFADNVHLFHGREIRNVPRASGGMGLVLHLSLANNYSNNNNNNNDAGNDPEGWTRNEIQGYDGWGHDVGRIWRQGPTLEKEGFVGFRQTFGPDAYSLHHRFYLHLDGQNRIWLSAEDGCEGTPAATGTATKARSAGFRLF